jgi:hypothetical protein
MHRKHRQRMWRLFRFGLVLLPEGQ